MPKKIFSRQSPNLSLSDFKASLSTIKSGEIFSGPLVKEFERRICAYIGAKHCVLVNMGRTAELVALEALGLSRGDEIIIPSYNYPIVPIVAKILGLKPVFVDVQEDTFNIDPALIENKISAKTKAILITHMCGQPCDMGRILEIKNRYGLKLVEDAVHSFGAEYKGNKVGTFGDVSYFSFYVGKTMTTFMGASVCTNNQEIFSRMKEIEDGYSRLSARRLLKAVNYGVVTYSLTNPLIFSLTVYPFLFALNILNSEFLDNKMAESVSVPSGLPSDYLTKFTNLQAAAGLSQLEKLPITIEKRIRNATLLSDNITPHPFISLPLVRPDVRHTFLYYLMRVKDRKRFRKKMLFRGIDTKKDANLACSHLDIFKDEYSYCPVSERLSSENTLIPNYPQLSHDDILYIADSVNKVAKDIG